MYNTPPCINIFAVNETLKWVKSMGGVAAMEKRAIERADLLYAEIDRNPLFRPTVEKGSRSRMNIPFIMAEGKEELQDQFLKFASSRNIVGLKGHRSVGGFRASTYNACTIDDVKALVKCMQDFEKEV
jgi:phosphoserine aminotransferase